MNIRPFLPLLLLVVVMTGCKQKEEKADEADIVETAEAVAEVDTMVLHTQTFQKQLLCNGNLYAIKTAELTLPGVGGNIESVLVKNGQRVSKGQLIALADTRDKALEVEKAKDNLERASIELQDKLITLGYDGNAQSMPADLRKRAESLSGYTSAKYALQSAQDALKDCRLVAPFSGRITDLQTKAFRAGDKLCTIIDDSYFDVRFKILEAELNFIKIGTRVKISPFISPDLVLNGVVSEINPTVDDKGVVTVTARIKNTSSVLLDGMNVRVVVENAVPHMLVVPKSAVVERDGYHVVFMYDKETHRSVWTYVDILYENLTSFAITGCAKKETTVKPGDIVIVSGNLNLADDTEVTISHAPQE